MKKLKDRWGEASTEDLLTQFFGVPTPSPTPSKPPEPVRPKPKATTPSTKALREKWGSKKAEVVEEAPSYPETPFSGGPVLMDCGHFDYAFIGEVCDWCIRKIPPQYQSLKGPFIRPIPKGLRRTLDKVGKQGYPGMCCDEKGFYIGGVFNDCTRHSDVRCEVHMKKEPPLPKV